MSDSHDLKLNLHKSFGYSDNDDDDEEFLSVSSNLGEDEDTYRVLDEAVIKQRHLYGPEHSNKNKLERRFDELPEPNQENRSQSLFDNCENSASIDHLLPEKLAETVDPVMLQAMDRTAQEMEELEKEREYQLKMKQRIKNEVQWNKEYSLPVKLNNGDNNNNKIPKEDQVEHQSRYIDHNQQNSITDNDEDNKEENLYDSLEAEQPPETNESRPFPPGLHPQQPAFDDNNQPSKTQEFGSFPSDSYPQQPAFDDNNQPFKMQEFGSFPQRPPFDDNQLSNLLEYGPFPTSSNPLQPAFNDDNLDQFYPKSPQKDLKSTGPVKGDHMIFSQMWSDEELYHEFEKMANDYNKSQALHAPNLVYPPNSGYDNYVPPLPSSNLDYQGSNPPVYLDNSEEMLWNNLSQKKQMPKENPITIDFARKPKAVLKASTNYVEYNKSNYSKMNPKQSYRARHNFRKDISGSLSKIPQERKALSGRSEPMSGQGFFEKPSSAEDTWKNRSAQMIFQMEQKLPPLPGKLQKYPSDSRVNYRNTRPHYLQPLNPNVQSSVALVPVDQRLGMSSPSVMELEPISKDFLMDDGQRISVDISLKLMSPPVSSRMPKDEMNMGMLQALPPFYANEQAYQVMNYQNPAVKNSQRLQEQYSSQTLPDLIQDKSPPSEYQGPHNTEAMLNRKIGYAARYQHQRDPKPKYKVYSVDDYRKMQKEVKLGKLGPDMDSETLREKVEKRQKQIEYAKRISEANKGSLKSRKPAAPPQPKSSITEEQKNRRKLAIEYGKSVPKPLVKVTTPVENVPQGLPPELPPTPQNQLPVIADTKPKNTKSKKQLINCEELEKLCLRHEEDKRNAENIRKKIIPPS